MRFASFVRGLLAAVLTGCAGATAVPTDSEAVLVTLLDAEQLDPGASFVAHGQTLFDPRSRVHATMREGGVELRAEDGGRATFALAGEAHVEGARFEAERPGAREWWLAGPRGIEHAIAVDDGPQGELRVEVRIDTELHVLVHPARADFVDDTRIVRLRYEGVRAIDATGRALDAWMERAPHGLVLVVDCEGATYPVAIDPVVVAPRGHLDPPEGVASGGNFGVALAIDGETLFVGDDALGAGVVWVFRREGLGWIEAQRLDPPTSLGTSAHFGKSVAVDGDALVVGAPNASSGTSDPTGAVLVYRRGASGWALEDTLRDPMAYGSGSANLGMGVAVRGSRVIAGENAAGRSGLHVFVEETPGHWALEQPGIAGDYWGESRAVALDDTTLFVGAWFLPNPTFASGAVLTFERRSTWVESAQIDEPNEHLASDKFGSSLALDGDRLIVGAIEQGVGGVGGRAWVLRRTAGGWASEGELVWPEAPGNAHFGSAVAIAGDYAAVGAPDVGGPPVIVFQRSAGGWEELGRVHSDVAGVASFGASLALRGTYLAVGSTQEDAPSGEGRVYAYELAEMVDIGAPCVDDIECNSGSCADGVCCDVPCSGTADCRACSVAAGAAVDGTCGVVRAGTTCRASRSACDAAESCDGASEACPANMLAPTGTECRAASGPCDAAETCAGGPDCPLDEVAPDDTACGDGLRCNGEERCRAGACVTTGLCEDDDVCTAESCSESAGCEHSPIADCCVATSECDDANDTTLDSCVLATNRCEHVALGGETGETGCGCMAAGAPRGTSLAWCASLVALGLALSKRRRR